MRSATLVIAKKAKKKYKSLPQSVQKKVKKSLVSLQQNPLSGKKLSGELSGYRSSRVWPYRIIYKYNSKINEVQVTTIIHRQGAYK